MNLALGSIATAEANVVVRIRGGIIQIRTKRTCISPIIPIATAFHSALLITIQPIPMTRNLKFLEYNK